MSKKTKGEYRYDIALEEGVGPYLVAWVSGIMVFFVTLALAVNFGLSALTQSWTMGLSGSLTVELKPPKSGDPSLSKAYDANIQRLLALSRQHPAVKAARLLDKAEIRKLVEPWFVGGKLPDDLPLPALIDITVAQGADAARLKKDIEALVSGAIVDTHADMMGNIKALVATARMFVLLLTGAITALAVVSISGTVRAKFSIHEQEVETLHLIGASDEYIARQFRRHTLRDALGGACVGLVAMIAVLLVAGYATHAVDIAILPRLRLVPAQWVLLILSPVVLGSLVAHLTAQRAVMRELAKLS